MESKASMTTVFEAAAKWWADHLRQFDPTVDVGDKSINDMSMFVRLVKFKPIAAEQIDNFERELTTVLEKLYSDQGLTFDGITLRGHIGGVGWGVDYHPHPILEAAAQAAGIDIDLRMPLKTVMWLDTDGIKVSEGYGAPIEKVWSL